VFYKSFVNNDPALYFLLTLIWESKIRKKLLIMHMILEKIRLALRSTFSSTKLVKIPFPTRATLNHLCTGLRSYEKINNWSL
jgi:hypothetical protein